MNTGSLPVSFSQQAVPFPSLQLKHILRHNKCDNTNAFWEAGCSNRASDQKGDSFYLIVATYKLVT